MCFKNKWRKFTPTQEYLDVVNELTSIAKLHTFIKGFDYTGEKGDVWQTPEEFLKNEHLDCDVNGKNQQRTVGCNRNKYGLYAARY